MDLVGLFDVVERIYSQIPGYTSRPDLRDATTASSAGLVEHFLEMLAESQPETRLAPGAKARGYVRLLVERRISGEDLAAATASACARSGADGASCSPEGRPG